MSKTAAFPTLDPRGVTKSIIDKLPEVTVMDNVRETGVRAKKTIRAWWRRLPNDGVRIAIPTGVVVLIGAVITLVVFSIRRR